MRYTYWVFYFCDINSGVPTVGGIALTRDKRITTFDDVSTIADYIRDRYSCSEVVVSHWTELPEAE